LRTEKTLKNIFFGIGETTIKSLLGFVARTIFINILGVSYLGVNGLMLSILSMLSLAELGVGTAITFSLYKPLANNDTEKINLLMVFYKKVYRIISLIVFGLGLIGMLFLNYIIKDYQLITNLKLIYFIYLVNTAYSYLFSYKRTLLSTDQSNYLLSLFTTGFYSLTVITNIIILIIFKNYVLYLLTQFAVGLVENIVINRYIDSKYLYLKNKIIEKIPKEEIEVITRNVKAMFMHKIGDYAINGTDNIVISTFISIKMVGFYSNYFLLINTVNTFLMIVFNSATASFGNLITQETKEKSLQKFEVLNFLGFLIFGWATVFFYNLLNPFISLWIGNSYIIEQSIINLVLINFYLVGMRVPLGIIKMAAGIYWQDRYIPFIQGAVNLGFTILLVQFWGLAGVFMGTLISSIAVVCWIRPVIVYKYVFKTSTKQYFIQYLYYALVLFVNIFITGLVCNFFFSEYSIINFIFRTITCLIIPCVSVVALFYRTKEFLEIRRIITQVLHARFQWVWSV
jgi:O-antigen/teichoic acid export membrane protein